MSHRAVATARYTEVRMAAYRSSTNDLTAALGQPFVLTDWSNKAERAFLDQWRRRHSDVAHWDWVDIIRTHRDPDRIPLCIWGLDNDLLGLALGLTASQHVSLRFVEGCPDGGCRLRGKRALIAVDVMLRYEEATGRRELRVEPLNSALEAFYRDTLGFARVEVRKQKPYYRLEV